MEEEETFEMVLEMSYDTVKGYTVNPSVMNPEIKSIQEFAASIEPGTIETSNWWAKAFTNSKGKAQGMANDEAILNQVYQTRGEIPTQKQKKQDCSKFRLIAAIHLLELQDIVYNQTHSCDSFQLLRLIEQMLIHLIDKLKISLGTPEFTKYRLFCQQFVRNWLLPSEDVRKTLEKFTKGQHIKEIVLGKCPTPVKVKLEYTVDKKELNGNLAQLLNKILFTLRADESSSHQEKITSPDLFELQRVARIVGPDGLKQSAAWKIASGEIPTPTHDIDHLDATSTAYQQWQKGHKAFYDLYVLASKIHTLSLEKTVYFGTTDASIPDLRNLVTKLFLYLEQWDLRFGMPEMKTFLDFCASYAQISLLEGQDPNMKRVKAMLNESASGFRESVLYECSNKRFNAIKSLLSKLGQSQATEHVAKKQRVTRPSVVGSHADREPLGLVLERIWMKRIEKGQPKSVSLEPNIVMSRQFAEKVGQHVLEKSMAWLYACGLDDDTHEPKSDRVVLEELRRQEGWDRSAFNLIIGRFKFASIIHVLQLDQIVYKESHGASMFQIGQVLERELMPLIGDWKITLGSTEFEQYRHFCQNYMRNWLISPMKSKRSIVEKMRRKTASEKFKEFVLVECSHDLKVQLTEAFFHTVEPNETLGDVLQELWQIRSLSIQSSRIVNPAVLALHQVTDTVGQANMEHACMWLSTDGTNPINQQEHERLTQLFEVYQQAYKNRGLDFDALYTVAAKIHLLNLEDVIYYGSYNASYTKIVELVSTLFELIEDWGIKLDSGEMTTFRTFCQYYLQNLLLLSDPAVILRSEQMLNCPDLRESVLFQCPQHRKQSAQKCFGISCSSLARSDEASSSKRRRSVSPCSSLLSVELDEEMSQPFIGRVLKHAWDHANMNSDVFTGSAIEPDIAMLSSISKMTESVFPGLEETYRADGDTLKVEEKEIGAAIQAAVGKNTRKKFQLPVLIQYCRLACKLEILGVAKMLYSLRGPLVSIPIIEEHANFLFQILCRWNLKRNTYFRQFAYYYMLNALRLQATKPLLQSGWILSKDFKEPMEQGRIVKLYQKVKVTVPCYQHDILALDNHSLEEKVRALRAALDQPGKLVQVSELHDLLKSFS